MSKRPTREQLLVEQDVQLSLILRAVFYGTGCMTYFTVIQFFTQANSRPEDTTLQIIFSLADEAIYWVPGFFMLGPMMVYDMLRVTNRVAGPIFAMRRQLVLLNQGEEGRQVKFRNDDHWNSLATEFNTTRSELLSLRADNVRLQNELNASSDSSQESSTSLDAVVPR